MAKPLSVLFVSSEVIPFAKTGGLADVSAALPQVVRELGHDIRIIMPKFAAVSDRKFKIHDIKRLTDMPIKLGDRTLLGSVKSSFLTNIKTKVQVYFLSNDELYCRSDLYVDPKTKKAWPDNDERFIFFCRGVIRTMLLLGWKPDIIHLNDWQTGLIAALLKTEYADEPLFKNTKIVFTVHNAAYQGVFPGSSFEKTGLPEKAFKPEGLEFHGDINLMKAGLMYADQITTVSPTYAKEIRSDEEYGFGLEGVFKKKARKTVGLLNGMDTTIWNPEIDKMIPQTYSDTSLEDKQVNKKALCEHFGLPYDPAVPVLGIVSRLADQKGFDLIKEQLVELMKLNIQLVVLGSGEKKYEDLFTKAAKKYKKKLGAHIGFDEELAHLIEAGSDMFLMPSKYEPCGLNQMYSLRYGTLPIVRATGGLADSVEDLDAKPKAGTGFVFDDYKGKQMLGAVKRAVKAFGDEKTWQAAMKRAMKKDNSWDASAKKYIELYKKLLKKK
ncbi:MAG: glycogen synthase GlgA [Ignavibacteria bacterium]|nr:MAG: glycogen synthase GlgA [Ignavibacteria bacterium]